MYINGGPPHKQGDDCEHPDSDLDLLVDLGPGLILIDLAGLELELGETLGLSVELAIKDRAETAHRKAHSRRGGYAVTRDPVLFLDDILVHAREVRRFVESMTLNAFARVPRTGTLSYFQPAKGSE